VNDKATPVDRMGAFRSIPVHQLSPTRATYAKPETNLLQRLQAPLVDPICEKKAMTASWKNIDAVPDTAVPRHRLPRVSRAPMLADRTRGTLSQAWRHKPQVVRRSVVRVPLFG
jgi:hypothetical protein